MQINKTWSALRLRLPSYAAGVVVRIADTMLRLAQRMYLAGYLNLAGIENVVRLSGQLRHLAWRLLKSKRASR